MDCFIIMPISTPEFLVEKYGGDHDHFLHVLEYLFIPAITAAGLKPVSPIAQGADLIHAEIVKQLETADIVLCDMSSLNANVFFEIGIRTAVNKPVALVKDDITIDVPFDTRIINSHTYLSSLEPWTLKVEVDKLQKHISQCVERAEAGNTLWRYFSLTSHVAPVGEEDSLSSQLQFMNLQIEALRAEFRDGRLSPVKTQVSKIATNLWDPYLDATRKAGVMIIDGKRNDNTIRLSFEEEPAAELRASLESIAAEQEYNLELHTPGTERRNRQQSPEHDK